jgi:hypothetical protein
MVLSDSQDCIIDINAITRKRNKESGKEKGKDEQKKKY